MLIPLGFDSTLARWVLLARTVATGASVVLLSGCSAERPESTGPLDRSLKLRLLQQDLLQIALPPKSPPGSPPPQPPFLHLEATVDIPENAVLGMDARITRRENIPHIGPVTFVVRVAGEEIFRQVLEGEADYLKAVHDLPLDRFAGSTAEIELSIEEDRAAPGTGFYWHRATLDQLSSVQRAPQGAGRNLLLVVVDTLRADHMSLYGYPRPTTPTLDALADQSLVFDRAFSSSSWTLPSTVTLLTGLSPPRHDVIDGGNHLYYHLESLPERLAPTGITTFAASANPLISPDLEFDQGFETYRQLTWGRAEELNHAFLDWLDQAQEFRWFAYLHYIDPHDPYDAPPPGDRWVDPAYDGPFTDPELLNKLYLTVNWGQEPGPGQQLEEEDLQHLRNGYDGEILYWDQQFAGLIAELEERGLLDQTIVVVTSDHGEEFLEHGMLKHGHQLYDESLHVPLLVRAPGRVVPGRHPEPVSLEGLHRALLQLMGTGPESRPEDLLRLPEGLPIFGHTRIPIAPDQPRHRFTVASVRDGGSWMVHRFDDGTARLYDLATDPGQVENRIAEDPDEARRLGQLLDAWLRSEQAGGKRAAPPPELDPESLERLRALGYVQ